MNKEIVNNSESTFLSEQDILSLKNQRLLKAIENLGYPVYEVKDGIAGVSPNQYHNINWKLALKIGFFYHKLSEDETTLLDALEEIPFPPDGEIVSGNFELTLKDCINLLFPKKE